FCWLPVEKPSQRVQAPVCCLDLLLDCQICPGSPPGVWVCSTDMILISWEGFSGARVLALPGDVSYAVNHGVYLPDQQGQVRDIIYKETQKQILQAVMPDGKVPMQVSGPVFFSSSVSEKLLQTHVTPPLDGCTYLGLDSGAPPLQISLFLDVLKCLCSDLTQDQFVREVRTGCSSPDGPQGAAVRRGRTELWRILRGTPLTLYIPGGRYDYLTLSGRQHMERLCSDWTDRNTLSHIQREDGVNQGARIINSILEGDVTLAAGSVVQHCHLQGPLEIASGCLLSGLELMTSQCLRQLELANDIIIQGHCIELGDLKLKVYTVMGVHDNLEVSSDDGSASFLNQRWSLFYSRTGIPEELWVRGEQRSLLEARLFPVLYPRGGDVVLEGGVGWLLGGGGGSGGSLQRWREAWRLSLKELMSLTHQEAELQWREDLLFRVGRRRVVDALCNRTDACLLPCFRAVVLGGQQGALLETLDAAGSGEQEAESELGLAARCLTCIADVLVCMAGGMGGIRSGPAANEAWSHVYFLLEQGNLRGGVQALAAQREHWLSPDLLVRAARHYEGAGQVLLRQALMSSQRFISIGQSELPPLEEWQEVECPARLDLAGWSDTPPIAFEQGGSVTNIAVKVDGKRPIGARARRIKEPRLLLVSHSGGRGNGVTTVCERLDDMRDHCQPQAPALLKAVCVCSGLVSLSSKCPLGDQLMQRWGGGVELHSWSVLPTGSGLTSSILAGALLAAVYRCTGRTYTTDSLIHAVLYLEQILTTGGWQDQVGGLVGGVKVGRSGPSLPLKVEVEHLSPSKDFLLSLEQHLLLVYTGKTRLARNLLQLQNVVRSWYSRLPSMVQNANQLVANSEDCARACSESLSALGACLERSWQQKKLMAPGSEPASVRVMMEALRPLVLGQSLAGAGGGGFLYVLTREPQQQQAVLRVLNNTQGLGNFSVHSVEVDMDGIT
uniref:L-fucose kinase n=1 Tax=Mola mola TaxID=94237 RepID=A0A3Q3XKC6_MOLML